MQRTCQVNRDDSDKSCVEPALEDSDNGYCLEHEIEFLKWCITANRARIKELEQVQEQKGTESCQAQDSTTKASI